MLSMCREVNPLVRAVKVTQKDFTTTNRFVMLQEDYPELEAPTTTTTDATSGRRIQLHLQTTRNVQP